MIVELLILGIHVYGRAGGGFQLLSAANMIDVRVRNDDSLHAQFVLRQNGQDLVDLVSGINDYGFAALLVAKNGAIALQYADWQDFVDHSSSLAKV
jgi:hypothetical protein